MLLSIYRLTFYLLTLQTEALDLYSKKMALHGAFKKVVMGLLQSVILSMQVKYKIPNKLDLH